MNPIPPHLALKMIDERERQLRRAAELARLRADGKPARPRWRDRLQVLTRRRQPRIGAVPVDRPEIDLRRPEVACLPPIKTRDAV